MLKAIFFLCLLVLFSCSKMEKNIINENNFNSKTTLTFVHSDSKELLNVEDFLVVDSMLLVINNREDSIIMLYNIPGFVLKASMGELGRAPQEFLLPRLVSSHKNINLIYDFGKSRFFKLDVEKQVSHEALKAIRIVESPQSLVCFGDSVIIFDCFDQESGKIVKYTSDGEKCIIYDFKDLRKKIKDPRGYWGFLDINPLTGDIVYAYQYIRRFDIIDMNGKLKCINVFNDMSYPVLVDDNMDQFNNRTYYFGVSTTKDRIYLYYIGKSANEVVNNKVIKTYIEEYDWNGNPIKRYEIDRLLKSVKYWNGNFIGLDMEREFPFIVYYTDK